MGIIVLFEKKTYCIPLSSPKAKHKNMKNAPDFSKIYDRNNKLIGVLNFNNMIPVTPDVVKRIDMNPKKYDTPKDMAYKGLLNAQLDWCNDNVEAITKKASKLYTQVTETPEKNRDLTRRCCDFKKLELAMDKYISKH